MCRYLNIMSAQCLYGVELQIPLTSNNNLFQECHYDNHIDAAELRRGRVRFYLVTYTITPDCPCGCPNATTYILENYLIIDNTTESDAGDYTFTANIHGADPTTIHKNFSTIVGIYYSTYVISHRSSCFFYVFIYFCLQNVMMGVMKRNSGMQLLVLPVIIHLWIYEILGVTLS